MNTPLARLIQLLPPPSAFPPKGWESIEAELDVGPPTDQKELIDAASEQAEVYEELWDFEEKPGELEEEGSFVVPWATTDNGEWLFWRASPDVHPDSWTVLLNEAHGEEWEHYEMTCTEFLVAAPSGDVAPTFSGLVSRNRPVTSPP